MSKAYSDGGAAKRYDAARAMPPETAALWMGTLGTLLPGSAPRRVLDLGCGTGRFTELLGRKFGCDVVGVDPSAAMLAEGRSRNLDGVMWKNGSGESIPLESDSLDLIWMSQVFHHLDDPPVAMDEIRRVLAPGGRLALRNGTRENNTEIPWLHCFPEAQEIDDDRLPSQQDLVSLVCGHGFERVAVETIYQFFASSYEEYYDKISQRGLSALISISDGAFATGLVRLRQWVARQPTDAGVYEPVDLFVFKSTQATSPAGPPS